MATDTDYLIIGAGPAGLQLGHHFDRANRDYRILAAGPTPGTGIATPELFSALVLVALSRR